MDMDMKDAIELTRVRDLRKLSSPFNTHIDIKNNNFTDDNIHACVKFYMSDLIDTETKEKNPIGNWKVSKVTDMHNLFSGSDFNEPLNWDLSKVTNMSGMFKDCNDLNSPINFKFRNVTDMSSMFENCIAFDQPVIIDNFNLKLNCSSMFKNCTRLNSVITMLSYDVTNTSSMFENCIEFDQAFSMHGLSLRNSSKMFKDCKKFNSKINFQSIYVRDMSSMFENCIAFNQSIKDWSIENAKNRTDMVKNCPCEDTNLPNEIVIAKHAKQILAIGIFSHGKFVQPIKKIHVPKDVTIHKQNKAAYGCICISEKMESDERAFEKTKEAFLTLDKCVDPELYIETSTADVAGKHRSAKPFHSIEGICTLFTDESIYEEKHYIVKINDSNRIIMAYVNSQDYIEHIDLVSCTQVKLEDFFKSKDSKVTSTCSDFITYSRDRVQQQTITTSRLYTLIALARDYLDIKQANIYDPSCNTVQTNINGQPAWENLCTLPPPKSAWGGTRKIRRKKTIRKRKRHTRKTI